MNDVTADDVNKTYEQLKNDAESSGYYLNSDENFTKELVKSLLINELRYGYRACPCRLSSGNKSGDLDIICPCDYRDADLNQYDTCYCALYVTKDVIDKKKTIGSIPERRPVDIEKRKSEQKAAKINQLSISKPVWRCRVCGYLCARDEPPNICPICKVKKERFERFI